MSKHPKMYMYKRIVDAKRFIDEHYASKIDLDKIAGSAHFSKFHFLRLFKESFGKSPHKYLTEVRIQHAKALLKGDQNLSQICFAVGFESITSFTHLFKKHTGLSPKAFRIRELDKSEQIQQKPLSFVPNCFVEQYQWNK